MDLAARKARLLDHRDALFEAFDTPLYAFFEEDLRRNYREVRAALDDHYPDSTIHFAVKANYNLGVLSVLRDEGCHAEAYARCELTATQAAGFDPEDVLLTGMNRPVEDVERALDLGVERFLVDNEQELAKIREATDRTGTEAEVLIRGNPAMEVPTHPEVATATRESKFGLDIESGRALAVAEDAVEAQGVELVGVQLHVGSQIRGVEPYEVAAREMLSFAADVRDATGVEIDVLDLGGGFPVPYDEEVPDTETIVASMADAVRSAAADRDLAEPTLCVEPGRRLVGNAGALLAEVGVVKETPHASFAVLDAGTNAVSSYWPYPIYALSEADPTEEYHVAGPLCYTGDVIQEDVALPELDRGDVLVVDRIGAYSLGSASHTNAEPKPPVALVRESGDVESIRARETCEDVLGNDRIPDDLRGEEASSGRTN
ncbi:diaminopimelate decarboxylase [Halorussus gelatinilyticus]|uniref:Diaminopimelate decarboxylase n=1 Tax=Halorussus gelatinilyticus TaxID=2937524 RepID=A0A8U0IMY4_9EURY|nr:diaminopimelate decarboxylase [Halorussus gelatinilyticus]UPW02108.1 diaminopimelate decarboxylase [Halorussus gelatinilyticus]